MIATAVLAVGAVGFFVVRRADVVQRQASAVRSQRASYSTLQQEIATQGIDPTRIMNPLSSVATPINTGAGAPLGFGDIRVDSSNIGTGTGGAHTSVITVQGASNGGPRSGGLGVVVTASGDPTTVTPTEQSTLAAPTMAVSLPLSTSDFPAIGWFAFPSNPAGTFYRYTTDGSDPTTSSPVWNYPAASALTSANFTTQMKIAAFNLDAHYNRSAVLAVSNITMFLPDIVGTRYAGGTSLAFSYTELTSSPGNGLMLTPSVGISGISANILYTIDGSDPRSSGSAATYGSNLKVAPGSWTVTGPTTATITLRAALVSSDPRYVSPAPTSFVCVNSPETLATPTFSHTSAQGPVSEGTSITIIHPSPTVDMRYDKWTDPTTSSVAGWSIVVP